MYEPTLCRCAAGDYCQSTLHISEKLIAQCTVIIKGKTRFRCKADIKLCRQLKDFVSLYWFIEMQAVVRHPCGFRQMQKGLFIPIGRLPENVEFHIGFCQTNCFNYHFQTAAWAYGLRKPKEF